MSLVQIYTLALWLFFLFGVLENHVDSEGMGFFPLMVFTTPWSWLLTFVWDYKFWGAGMTGRHEAIFVTCNVIGGGLNALILYLILKWRQRRATTARPY